MPMTSGDKILALAHLQKAPNRAKMDFIGPVQPVWQRCKFPTLDIDPNRGYGAQWFASRSTIHQPYCWTPARPFHFGGKRFIWGYPCIAFATTNFGFVTQRGPDGIVFARV